MLFTIPYDRLTHGRLPWVTLGVAVVWLVVSASAASGWPGIGWDALALVPTDVRASGLAGHWLLHETWAHLVCGVLLLLILGPVLEEAWGRPFYAGFLALMVLYTSGAYLAVAGDSPRPVVGATATLAALLGACMGRQLEEGIHYTAVGWWREPVHVRFWVPAYALIGLWFASEVAMQLVDDGVGPTRGVSYAGQAAGALLGAAIARGLRLRGLEQSWLKRLPEDAAHPALAEAELALSHSGAGAALRVLSPAVRMAPDDPALVAALCRAALEAREPETAVGPFLRVIQSRLRAGDGVCAALLWRDHAKALGRPSLDARAATQLAEALSDSGQGLDAVRVVRSILDSPSDVTTGMALRIVDIARSTHAGLAIRAAHLALEGADFAPEKRERIEATVRKLEALRAERLDPQLDDAPVRADRSIEIAPEADLRRPPPGRTRPAAPQPELRDDSPFELSRDADLSAPEAEADTVPLIVAASAVGHAPRVVRPGEAQPIQRELPQVMPSHGQAIVEVGLAAAANEARFADAKCLEVVPVAWETGRLSLRQGDSKPSWLNLDQVEAVAAAAVLGLASKPVVLIDLLLNWSELRATPLRVVRLRSDRFDPNALLPEAGAGLGAFRALIDALIEHCAATPLPDPERARGRPFAMFDSLEAYEREVLQLDR